MAYPVDETQNKINPSGYSNVNPFWANTVGGGSGTELPPGSARQYLSLKNTVTGSPEVGDLQWKDIEIPDVDLSNYYTKAEVDASQTLQDNKITENSTGLETVENEITQIQTNLTNKADTTYVNEQVQLVTESTDNKIKNKSDISYVDSEIQSVETKIPSLDNYYTKAEVDESQNLQNTNITKNTNDIGSLRTVLNTDVTNLQTNINEVTNSVTDLETKVNEDIHNLANLQTTLDTEMAEINADIVPSKTILAESMKEGNSDKVYGFKRGSGTEADPYNQAVEIVIPEDNYMLTDMSNANINNVTKSDSISNPQILIRNNNKITILKPTDSHYIKYFSFDSCIYETLSSVKYNITDNTKQIFLHTSFTTRKYDVTIPLYPDGDNYLTGCIFLPTTTNKYYIVAFDIGVNNTKTSFIYTYGKGQAGIPISRSIKVVVDNEGFYSGTSPSLPADIAYNNIVTLNKSFANVNYIPSYITNFILHVNATETASDSTVTTDVFGVYMTREADGHFKGNYSVVDEGHETHIYSFDGEYVKQADESYNLNLKCDISLFNDNGTFGTFDINTVEVMKINIGASGSSVDLSNYYTKEEVNTMLLPFITRNQVAESYYNKEEVDSKISSNLVDTTNFYNKTEIDTKTTGLQTQIATLQSNENSIYEELGTKADTTELSKYVLQTQVTHEVDEALSNYSWKNSYSFSGSNDWFDWSKLVGGSLYLVEVRLPEDAGKVSFYISCVAYGSTSSNRGLSGFMYGSQKDINSNLLYVVSSQGGYIYLKQYVYTNKDIILTNINENPIKAVYTDTKTLLMGESVTS